MPIPTIIMTVSGCMVKRPKIEMEGPTNSCNQGLADMAKAENGIISMPTIIEVTARYFFITWVIKTTNKTTTAGLTLASHSGLAASPCMRMTYLGMVA